jgi:hypothetical protein
MLTRLLMFSLCLALNPTAFAASPSDEKIVSLTDSCAGNDVGRVDQVDRETFSQRDEFRKIRERNKKRDCRHRIYSTDKVEAVRLTKSYLLGKLDHFAESSAQCLRSEMSKGEYKQLLRLVEDPSNISIIVDAFDHDARGANSESCAYYHFHILRKNGNLVRIIFDQTT